MIKAVLFDLDGVLLDSNGWHAESLNRALVERGYPAIARTMFQTTKVMDEAGVPEDERVAIIEFRWTHALRLLHQRAEPNIVIQHCLAALKVDGYRVLICSSSMSSFVMGAMWRLGIPKYIDGVISGEMVKKRKPDPECYQLALTSTHLQGSEALVVEDGETGIAAARSAGCHVMAVHGVMGVSYATVMHRINEIDFGSLTSNETHAYPVRVQGGQRNVPGGVSGAGR